jgi:hypothetical protein
LLTLKKNLPNSFASAYVRINSSKPIQTRPYSSCKKGQNAILEPISIKLTNLCKTFIPIIPLKVKPYELNHIETMKSNATLERKKSIYKNEKYHR